MILYLSNYGDINSGWAVAAQEMIRALSTKTKVVPRRFKLAPQNPPQDILQMEDSTDKCKVCIQQCLPPMMQYDGDFYNIGVVFTESDSLGVSGWGQYLNMMDEVWTFSNHSESTMKLDVPVRVFPLPIDLDRLYKAPSFNLREQCQGDFLFYTVADFNKRKNLTGLIKAFHLEFAHWEPVNLLIKTNAPTQEVEHLSQNIKRGLKLYDESKYKKEIIISGYLEQDQVYSIHKSADVFVLPSHGEGWSIPTQEALCLGKTPIVTDCSSLRDLVSNETGWLVKSSSQTCFNSTSVEGLHTGHDTWAEPDLNDLRRCMREAYENTLLRKEKSLNGLRDGLKYSHEQVGESLFKALKDNALKDRV